MYVIDISCWLALELKLFNYWIFIKERSSEVYFSHAAILKWVVEPPELPLLQI